MHRIQALLGPKALRVQPVFADAPVKQVLLGQPGHKAYKVSKASLGSLVRKGRRVSLGPRVHKGHKVSRDKPEQLDILVSQGPREDKARLETRGQLGHAEQMAIRVAMVQPAPLAQPVAKVLLAKLDKKAILVPSAPLAPPLFSMAK